MTIQPIQASVTSAVELTKTEKEEIASLLSQMTGNSSVLTDYVIDPEVLGGLRVEVGDWMLDTTISHQLMKLSHQLMKR